MLKLWGTTAAAVLFAGLIGCRDGGSTATKQSAVTANESNIPDRRAATGREARGESDTFGNPDETATSSDDPAFTGTDDERNPEGTTASADPRGARASDQRRKTTDKAVAENRTKKHDHSYDHDDDDDDDDDDGVTRSDDQ
jgi:hypothetical protein